MQPNEYIPYNSIRDVVFRAARLFPEKQFYLSNDKDFPSVTGSELKNICGKFGYRMKNSKGAHVALLGPSSTAWITFFYAIISSACVAIPLQYGSEFENLEYSVRKSDSLILLYDKKCEKIALELQEKIPGLIIYEFHKLLDEINTINEQYFPDIDKDSCCALFFTSGTTSKSHAVILTHYNLASHASFAMSCLPLGKDEILLSILPTSHTMEISTNIVGALHFGMTIYINESIRTLKPNLQKYGPSILVSVPLLLETIQKEIINTAKKQGKLKKFKAGLKLSAFLQFFGIDISRKLFREVYETLDGNLWMFICGGARLDKKIIEFYKHIGITVYEGYGITECSPIVCANYPGQTRTGSLGKSFGCCEVKVIDGEICVRGDSVSPGYYNDEKANEIAYIDGWFHTGDLGEMDSDGYLYYKGRKKNLIILSNGENISPEELEFLLYKINGIKDVIVFEKDGKITAEIYPDINVFPDRTALWNEINKLNRTLPRYKQIGDIIVRKEPFEKTFTQKIKR